MTSLQANAVLPNAANAAKKASTQTIQVGGSDHGDFAAMLNGTQSDTRAPEKAPTAPKAAAAKTDGTTDASHVAGKHGAKANGKADNKIDASHTAGNRSAKANGKADGKADGKTEKAAGKADRKDAAKTDDAANSKTDTAKSAVTAQQAADATGDESDPAKDNANPQTASNQTGDTANAQSAASQQLAAQIQPQQQSQPDTTPQAQQAAQQVMAAAAQAATAQTTDTTPQTQQVMAAAQAAPAQMTAATAQTTAATAQTITAPAQPSAATPPTGAVTAPANAVSANSGNTDNIDNNVAAAGPPSKGARTSASPRPMPNTADNKTADNNAAPVAANAGSDTSPTAVKTDTPASAATGDNLKSVSHQDGKDQSGAAPDIKADATPQPQPQPVAQPVPQPATPAPAMPAVNPMAVTAAAPAANNAGGNATLSASLHVAPQGPTPNVDSLAVEIAARSQGGAKEFQIRLDPPELGHVEVRLSIDASGKAEAHMSADQQQTLDLLQKNSPTLTSALRDAGLDVSQSGLNFSLRGQDRQGGDNADRGAQARGSSLSLAATKTIDAVQSANPYLSSAGDARLDIHV